MAASAIQSGLLNVQSLHTTAAIVVNEHDPLLLTDMTGLLERLAPVDAVYRHDNITLRTANCVLGEPPNGHSHCRALLLGPIATLNVVDGALQLRAVAAGVSCRARRTAGARRLAAAARGWPVNVKLILPALTEATSPLFRPIKYSLFPPLGLATLAAYLDADDEAEIQDEHVEPLRLNDAPDLVVIQVYITSAYRAYRIADHYRARGAYVVLGGLHVTSLRATSPARG